MVPRAWEPVSRYTSLFCEKFMNDWAFLAWKYFFHELENYARAGVFALRNNSQGLELLAELLGLEEHQLRCSARSPFPVKYFDYSFP